MLQSLKMDKPQDEGEVALGGRGSFEVVVLNTCLNNFHCHIIIIFRYITSCKEIVRYLLNRNNNSTWFVRDLVI